MRRRALMLAFLLAATISLVNGPTTGPTTNVDVPSACLHLTPDDWFLWWWYGCSKDSAGGGEGGAG